MYLGRSSDGTRSNRRGDLVSRTILIPLSNQSVRRENFDRYVRNQFFHGTGRREISCCYVRNHLTDKLQTDRSLFAVLGSTFGFSTDICHYPRNPEVQILVCIYVGIQFLRPPRKSWQLRT
jgi:hypothetical protein